MNLYFLIILVFIVIDEVHLTIINERAFVSTLLSNDFVLAARVMGKSLLKVNCINKWNVWDLAHNLNCNHPELPYLILYTSDVNNETLTLLEQHSNVITQSVEKINSPQYETHHAKKFQVCFSFLLKHTFWTIISCKNRTNKKREFLIAPKNSIHFWTLDFLCIWIAFYMSKRTLDTSNIVFEEFSTRIYIWEDFDFKMRVANYLSWKSSNYKH